MTSVQSLLLALTVGAVGFAAGIALDPQPSDALPETVVTDPVDPENQLLAQLQQRLARAIAPLDSAVIDSLSSHDFQGINAGGQVIDKAAVFRALANLPYELVHVVDDSIRVRRFGPFAIVTALETVSGRAATGPVTGQLRVFQVWVKRGERWQTVGSQAALVPPPSPDTH